MITFKHWGVRGLAVSMLLCVWASTGRAQMNFSLDEVESGQKSKTESKSKTDAKSAKTSDEEFGTTNKPDVINELAQGGTKTPDQTEAQGKEAVEEIYAVQRVYALRRHRIELAPSVAFNISDPYRRQNALGLAFNYWWTNALAIGANLLWYDFVSIGDTGLRDRVQRGARLGVPVNDYQMGLHVNFTYVPFYGKFAGFNKFIFQWDAYVIGGIGFLRTKPLPVFDPEVREFNYGTRAAFNVGLGVRIFFTRYLALFTEFRNYMFLERYENQNVAIEPERFKKSTWLQSGSSFTNAATIQLGLTFFLPPKSNYKKPK